MNLSKKAMSDIEKYNELREQEKEGQIMADYKAKETK